ncbi:polyprenyl diphosphate synthase [Alteromonas sp. a30]|uniref:polyprenyl diphosphate synthase n=1 Tax=Alteromonas sp. a30 TaxID=2730917 RepID=UPI0022832860|nr:polyprenyl diphosphate synthase [Alteromonas sp. a30]MCY7294321.1 di-trans,poly-cis-decaprenylcistransferase [Alteromonas sp. a30]
MSNPNMPRHVAIIMDGNGRWAKKKGKLRTFGHKAGVESVRSSVRFCRKNDIESLTLFAFSSENWLRPAKEVSTLMELFHFVLGSEVKKLHKNDVRLKVVGDKSRFDDKLVRKINEAEALTQNNQSLVLNIAVNYGGKWEIVNTCKQLIQSVQCGELTMQDINEDCFNEFTTLSEQPDVDLLIRTGGDKRISNFLLWHIAYAELYFTETLWPDFNEDAFQLAVDEFCSRQRRYGKIPDHQDDE